MNVLIEVGVEPRERLKTRRRLVVRLGTAPDGLPLLLSINRGTAPETLLLPVANAVGCDAEPEKWAGRLRELADQVRDFIDERQFLPLKTPGGEEGSFYLSWKDVRRIVGRTVLESLLETSSVTVLPQAPGEPATNFDTRLFADPDHGESATQTLEDQIQRRERLSNTKLAISVVDDDVAVARVARLEGGQPVLERFFVEESIPKFEGARFRTIRNDETIESGFGEPYLDARRGSDGFSEWSFVVSQGVLMGFAASLARRLGELHTKGLVHGDVKPSNVLATADAALPIDSLDIPIGRLSTGMTRGYAAPEQILGQPVSAATDQYAMGVLLSKVVGGVLYGQEASFTIPTGGTQLERFTMLKDPHLFLDPMSTLVPHGALQETRALIERCLSFDPKCRFDDMESLALALESLVASHEYPGVMGGELSYGQLVEADHLGLSWLVEDSHP